MTLSTIVEAVAKWRSDHDGAVPIVCINPHDAEFLRSTLENMWNNLPTPFPPKFHLGSDVLGASELFTDDAVELGNVKLFGLVKT